MAIRKKMIISYNDKFENPEFIIGRRAAIFWKGEVERGFDFVVSDDKRIIDAYKMFGVPEFEVEKPVVKRARRKPALKVKKDIQIS